MKLNLNLYITDHEKWLKHPENAMSYALSSGRHMDNTWTFVTEVNLDVDVDTQAIVQIATADLQEKINNAAMLVTKLEQRKAELLCLTYEPDEPDYDEVYQIDDEESLDDIASRENAIIDRRERR